MTSVVFVILAHLFLATSLRKFAKTLFFVMTFFSHMVDMTSVRLIRLYSANFAYFLLASWIGLWVGYAGMILISLYEMCLGREP